MITKPTLETIDAQLSRAHSRYATLIRALLAERDMLRAKAELACESSSFGWGCGTVTPVKDLIYLQGDDPTVAFWRCPHCKLKNKAFSTLTAYCREESGSRPYVLALRPYFASVELDDSNPAPKTGTDRTRVSKSKLAPVKDTSEESLKLAGIALQKPVKPVRDANGRFLPRAR